MKNSLILVTLLQMLAVFAFASASKEAVGQRAGGELKHGRYIGWIKLDDRNERIAAVVEFYLESPEDLTKFPRLNASLRLSLGGYNTHEYLTETFEDLKYDFDNGVLTFDEPKNDLILTTEVLKEGGSTKIVGQVFVRSSSVSGSVELIQESDEPGDDSEMVAHGSSSRLATRESSPFIPMLDGQYEGECDGRSAAFQVQTVRGLRTGRQEESEGNGLERYFGVTARLAFKKDVLCGDLAPGQWCTRFSFSGGYYNFYLGKLVFQGARTTEECDLKQGNLTCRIRVFDKTMSCQLKKKGMTVKPATFFPRRFHVVPTENQRQELPAPQPPRNEKLSSALRGKFLGYLHNETNDTYMVIRLNVVPYSSTDNPHNPNQMMISSIGSAHLGGSVAGPYMTQRYEARSFYVRPGFTLSGPNTDSFISITEWKQGYIRGEWHSHAFGRVGTVQLVKGELPTISADASVVQSFSGEFEGTVSPKNSSRLPRWLRFVFPSQPNDLKEHMIQFSGSYQSIVGNTPVRDIERGAFDPYTGRFGWRISMADSTTFSSGTVNRFGDILMYWPPAPMSGVLTNDYAFEQFMRKKKPADKTMREF